MVDLFDLLDLDRDGLLSRSELHTAARRLGWHWREAPVLALLDLLTTPGNSILFPASNGYREWVTSCIDRGKRILVIGGCTLNSCVRVSAIETRSLFDQHNLQVIVDLSLTGARAANFFPSQDYGGLTTVESAVRQMEEAGVRVVRSVNWACKNAF